jgi:C4-dicarboxylate transporter DctM subunit
MFMDSIPAIMIVTLVFLPLFSMLNIDALHAGLFMSVNLIAGLGTSPPRRVLSVCGLRKSRVPIEKMSRASLPFLMANIIVFFGDIYPGNNIICAGNV